MKDFSVGWLPCRWTTPCFEGMNNIFHIRQAYWRKETSDEMKNNYSEEAAWTPQLVALETKLYYRSLQVTLSIPLPENITALLCFSKHFLMQDTKKTGRDKGLDKRTYSVQYSWEGKQIWRNLNLNPKEWEKNETGLQLHL